MKTNNHHTMKQLLLFSAFLIAAASCSKDKTNPKYDYRCETNVAAYKYVGTNNGGAPFWQVHTWDTLRNADTNTVTAFIQSRTKAVDSIVKVTSNPDTFAAYNQSCQCFRQAL